MYIKSINLENFRSYRKNSFDFDEGVNLILGNNGSGKSNLLEAIYFLASGKSFRTSSGAQMIFWQNGHALVSGEVKNDGNELKLECQLFRPTDGANIHRRFLIDGVSKTRQKYLGVFKLVIFQPEDIRLVAGSPQRRREFLDDIFSAIEWRYWSAISQYNRALKHRNQLLDSIRLGVSQRSELFFWDQSLVKNSELIYQYRDDFIKAVNAFFKDHENKEIESLFLDYRPSRLTTERLEKNYQADVETGYTSCGPHRDDFSFNNLKFPTVDKNLAFWGSRGQQRLAVLALRLAQISFIENRYRQSPVLLLDDIFSELDGKHRQLVVDISGKHQTFFTSAEEEVATLLPVAKRIDL